jgi:3-methylcrotonyl-CoA carboxylase alpha subunit
VATGERLPLAQEEIAMRGHAIEARIYAEDPDRDFLPSTGRIDFLRTPGTSAELRIDTGVREGDSISRFYDPMIAKLIAWGEDRPAALRRLGSALAAYRIVGIASNVAFLRRVTAHDAFVQARLDTGLIARHSAALFPPASPPSDRVLALAALSELSRLRDKSASRASETADPWSPWHAVDCWWLNSDEHALVFRFQAGGVDHPVRVRTRGEIIFLSIGDRNLPATVTRSGSRLHAQLDGTEIAADVVAHGEERHVFCPDEAYRLRLIDPMLHSGEEEPHAGHLMAPMSGTVVAVLVEPGASVAKGAALLVLEAMKMEHTITAPAAGRVSAVNYRAGDQVAEGADLIDLEAAPASSST